jgi:hypothetical protein
MAAVIELKYFNTFWLKKLKTITDVIGPPPGTFRTNPGVVGKNFTINPGLLPISMNVGQEITMQYLDFIDPSIIITYQSYIVTINSETSFVAASAPKNYQQPALPTVVQLFFCKIINFVKITLSFCSTPTITHPLILELKLI